MIHDKGIIVLMSHIALIVFLVWVWVFYDGEKLKEIVLFMLGIYPLILYKVIGIKTSNTRIRSINNLKDKE